MELKCPNGCPADKFHARIVEYHDCFVDTYGVWEQDLGCDDADRPYSFSCPVCGVEVDFIY